MVESNRQKKIAGVLQKDLASVLQELLRNSGQTGIIVSVSKVSVTVDLSIAKVYVSIFPAEKGNTIVSELNLLKPKIKQNINCEKCQILLFIMMILLSTSNKLKKR